MIRTIGLVGVITALVAPVSNLVIQPESRVWVEGKSTVRDFNCAATEIIGAIESGPAASLSIDNLQSAVSSLALTIPVAKMDCGNGTMDGHMRKALKAEQHENIEFSLSSYTASPAVAGVSTLELAGTLRIAGADQPVTIVAEATQESDGTLRVQGNTAIRMTEWGVKPPSLMLGTMKVKDEVVVKFDIRLRQQ